jgi:hypothetical protein
MSPKVEIDLFLGYIDAFGKAVNTDGFQGEASCRHINMNAPDAAISLKRSSPSKTTRSPNVPNAGAGFRGWSPAAAVLFSGDRDFIKMTTAGTRSGRAAEKNRPAAAGTRPVKHRIADPIKRHDFTI